MGRLGRTAGNVIFCVVCVAVVVSRSWKPQNQTVLESTPERKASSVLSELPRNWIESENRFHIETEIQQQAQQLEDEEAILNNKQHSYDETAQIVDADEQGEASLRGDVQSLAAKSVDKRADAVIDMSKV